MDAAVKTLNNDQLRHLFIESGADDAGFVELERHALAAQKETIQYLFPYTRILAAFVLRLNRDNLLAPTRILASYETNRVMLELTQVQARILKALWEYGVRGLMLPAAYPMEMNLPAGKRADISHKEVAEQAGMGLMGNSRLVLHPRWGSAVLLGTMLLDCVLDRYNHPLKEKVCIECKQCIAACPVGSVNKEGDFKYQPCLIHNYRETNVGFLDWIDALISSPDMATYRQRFSNPETLSMWQSLTHGTGYKCLNCQAVCPAGSEVQAEYKDNPAEYVKKIVKPMIERSETIYVVSGSSAEKRVVQNTNKREKKVNIPGK